MHGMALSSVVATIEVAREAVGRHHSRRKGPGQCRSVNVQFVAAPVSVVWSLVRRFDRPQEYKQFVRGCALREGDGGVGSVREVEVASGLPASSSTERLDALDDERHVMSFSIVGGDHRLRNYRATTSLHCAADGKAGTVVVESYVVDVPPGNTEEDTIAFVDTIVRCNLRSLACIAEGIAGAGDR
ncbi:abscisic acid receptor PYL11-like [Zingiber officinale]|uniref:Uncharacterized protein n=1 Tax=Zingiber officinale TaxID=94328 RepID=A0A8J5FSF7_ZINOF|nr:abscisic acid receptor PYL11-like [Zingiber officinale]KAG6494246.1 hypothetical protein ZIOFF_049266 [Zingiber officinale]